MKRGAVSAVSLSTCLALALSLSAGPAAAATWRQTGPRGSVTALAVTPGLAGQPSTVVSSVEGQSLFRSSDGGVTWTTGTLGFPPPCLLVGEQKEAGLLVADPATPGTIYAVGPGFLSYLYRTTDAGLHWQPAADDPPGTVFDLAAVPGQPGHLLALIEGISFPIDPQPPCLVGGSTGLVRSLDGGASWSSLIGSDTPFAAVAVDPASPLSIYLAEPTFSRLLVSDASGTTRAVAALPHSAGRGQLALRVDGSTSPGTVFLVVRGVTHGLFRLEGTGGAAQLVESGSGIPATAEISDLLVDPAVHGRMWAATSAGVFTSGDHGNTWGREGDGLTGPVSRLALDPRPLGPLYAGTAAAGVYVLDRGSCQGADTVSCLGGERFEVGVSFQLADGTTGAGHVRPLTGDTAAFWFFDGANLEVLVKVLDGRPVNDSFWLFSGGLSDVKYTVKVTDRATGAVKEYAKAAGLLSSFADTGAFPGNGTSGVRPSATPAAASPVVRLSPAAPCTADARDLCLSSSRFRVAVSFSVLGVPGTGQAVPLTDDTGAFWFLGPDNLELAVKVLDGRPVNGHFWIFYGALSDLHYTLTVTDTLTGAVKIYDNPAGRLASFADTGAF
jgi:hypothetical protein